MPKNPPKGRGRRKTVGDLLIHTRNRLHARYGQKIGKTEHDQLTKMVREKQGEHLLRQTGSRSIWKLKPDFLGGEELFVVYNKEIGAVCTVLEPGIVEMQLREHMSSHE